MNKIHYFPNHFLEKPTVVIGEYCNNGCQFFHMSKAKGVFERYEVPIEKQKQVMDSFYTVDLNEPFDLDVLDNVVNKNDGYDIVFVLLERYHTQQLTDYLFNHKNAWYNRIGMKFYTQEQRNSFINKEEVAHSEEFVSYCDVELLENFIDDPDDSVRSIVARRCCDKATLDRLVKDPSWCVRREVAYHGYKDHLDELINDEEDMVRVIVRELTEARLAYLNSVSG